jgi:hypothetical protein
MEPRMPTRTRSIILVGPMIVLCMNHQNHTWTNGFGGHVRFTFQRARRTTLPPPTPSCSGGRVARSLSRRGPEASTQSPEGGSVCPRAWASSLAPQWRDPSPARAPRRIKPPPSPLALRQPCCSLPWSAQTLRPARGGRKAAHAWPLCTSSVVGDTLHRREIPAHASSHYALAASLPEPRRLVILLLSPSSFCADYIAFLSSLLHIASVCSTCFRCFRSMLTSLRQRGDIHGVW